MGIVQTPRMFLQGRRAGHSAILNDQAQNRKSADNHKKMDLDRSWAMALPPRRRYDRDDLQLKHSLARIWRPKGARNESSACVFAPELFRSDRVGRGPVSIRGAHLAGRSLLPWLGRPSLAGAEGGRRLL